MLRPLFLINQNADPAMSKEKIIIPHSFRVGMGAGEPSAWVVTESLLVTFGSVCDVAVKVVRSVPADVAVT